MRRLVTAASLLMLLSASTGFAQALPPAQRPATPPAQTPATPPAQAPATPPPQATPPPPFPAGAKVGIVNLQQIAQLSGEGKAATARINALVQKKQAEGQLKTKALTDNRTRLQQTGALMNEAARMALEREIDRQTREGERFEQDAQAEINELQNELQNEFNRKLFPILQEISQEKGLHMLLSAQDAGAIWWEPGTDLTLEAVRRLDALNAPRPAAAPAATPPATTPPATTPPPAPAPPAPSPPAATPAQ